MGSCQHLFADPRHTCPHHAPGESGLCIWHNPAVGKADPYVKALFLHADALLASTSLENTSPPGSAFVEAHLTGINLNELRLPGRDFTGADLRDALLDGCDLTASVFARANLRRASLRHAILRGADLRGANLSGTSLVGADLREADLSGAVLDGTVLLGADLRGANLAGAQVTDFQWNRLTRFHDIRGLDANPGQADGDTTQVFLAPLALDDLDTDERLAIDRDPELARTRIFSVGRGGSSASDALFASASESVRSDLAKPSGTLTRTRHRWPWLVVPALLGLVTGAALDGGALALFRAHLATVAHHSEDPHDLAALRTQHEADLTQLKELQERTATAADQLATLQQTAGGDSARVALLRQQLGDAQAELARLLDAEDRATTAMLAKTELTALNRDLAGTTAKQERLARILADGVERFRGDSERLSGELGEARSRLAAFESTQADNVRLTQKLAALTQERDTLSGLYQRTHGELVTAHHDIERYLARISGTQLQGLLAEDGTNAPLVPVVLGRPVSLGGEFLVTLTVNRATPANGAALNQPALNPPAMIEVSVVVQRPAAAANPDATVVLYDEKKRPLRRIATSFPHVDHGTPFVTLNASMSCDRTPAFARIILAPGLDDVAIK